MNLLNSERAAYERDVERITSPGQYFALAMNDPWFSWLRELSKLIVTIDEALDMKEERATAAEEDRLIGQARELISPSESGESFARRYFEAMQRDPGVVLAHSDMMRVFSALRDE
jgi:hypothetical protein